MPLLCPYLSGRSAFQDKLLDRTAKFLRQLALRKTQVLVKGTCGDSVGVTLTVGGDGDVLPNIHLRQHTELIHFPLYCPKCKKESLVNVKQQTVLVIKEPDALTQSR